MAHGTSGPWRRCVSEIRRSFPPMNSLLAANPFENPWGYAIVLIIGALVNWLAKRSQNRQATQPPPGDRPPATGNPPSSEFNLEDALRRLMGEEPLPPRQRPPVISDSAQSGPPSDGQTDEVEVRSTLGHSQSAIPTSLGQAAPGTVTRTTIDAEWEEAMHRFGNSRDKGRPSRDILEHRSTRRASSVNPRKPTPWRNPVSARQAWVASIVFGPPPSL